MQSPNASEKKKKEEKKEKSPRPPTPVVRGGTSPLPAKGSDRSPPGFDKKKKKKRKEMRRCLVSRPHPERETGSSFIIPARKGKKKRRGRKR